MKIFFSRWDAGGSGQSVPPPARSFIPCRPFIRHSAAIKVLTSLDFYGEREGH